MPGLRAEQEVAADTEEGPFYSRGCTARGESSSIHIA